MAKAGKEPIPAPKRLSLADIFARLHKRDTSTLPETTKEAVLKVWHTGRLPLVASKVREFRPACPVRPHVWIIPGPTPDDEKAKQYVEELRKTRIVGHLPATNPTTTVSKTVLLTTTVSETVLLDQPIPAEIPNKDIRFHWPTSSAIWHIEPGIIFAQFAIFGRWRKRSNENGRRFRYKLRSNGPLTKSIASWKTGSFGLESEDGSFPECWRRSWPTITSAALSPAPHLKARSTSH
jgi:hypothetical protein